MIPDRFYGSSLHLPSGGGGDGPCDYDWEEVLLDYTAYIVDERNHTTAFAKARGDKKDIQVTFCLTPPPRVSYFCCVCPQGDRTEFSTEPNIVATEGNLALISVVNGSPLNISRRKEHDYYVYRAPIRDGGRAMLRRLNHPQPGLFLHDLPYYFPNSEVGLLRYHTNRDHIPTLRRRGGGGDDDAYMVATICARQTEPDTYDLYIYDSTTQVWARHPTAVVDQDMQQQLRAHLSERVITVGGDAGTMGWVDLRHGVLLCDLVVPEDEHDSIRRLRYITLPGAIHENELCLQYRDIAVVQGRIKFVELQVNVRPGSLNRGCSYISDGWRAVTYSRTADDLDNWQRDSELCSSDIKDPAGIGEMLPTLQLPDGDKGSALERLPIGHPTLSLRQDDDIVYFMTKADRKEDKSWIIAVDMKKKTLLGVAEFSTPRSFGMEFTFMHTHISKYLPVPTAPPGAMHNMKRQGVLLPGSSRKKLPSMSMQPSEYGAQPVEGAENDGVDMDLE